MRSGYVSEIMQSFFKPLGIEPIIIINKSSEGIEFRSALMATALICLNVVGLLPWWITVVILIREIGITLWRMVELRRGNVVPASKGGKVKTALQAAAVLAFLIPLAGALGFIAWLLMYAALIVTVITGIQYILDSRKIAAGR